MINNKNTTKTMANQFEEPKPPQPQPHPLLEMLQLLHPPHPNGLVIKGLYELHPHPEQLNPQFILSPPLVYPILIFIFCLGYCR